MPELELVWIRGESGAVMQMSLPLHPGVLDRLEKGELIQVGGPGGDPVEPDVDDSAAPADMPPLPRTADLRHVWEEYAVAQGMDADDVRKLTKAQIIDAMSYDDRASIE